MSDIDIDMPYTKAFTKIWRIFSKEILLLNMKYPFRPAYILRHTFCPYGF